MSQEELAQKLNVTRQTVSGWETERCQPDIETLMVLADALDADIQELIYGTKPGQYLRYRRKYVFWSILCGSFSGIFALCWLFVLPEIYALFARYFMGHALYFTYWGLPQVGWFAFGVFLPAALQMFFPVRLKRQGRRVCVFAAIVAGLPGLLILLDTLFYMLYGQSSFLGSLVSWVAICPAGRLLALCVFPLLSGELMFLGVDRT